jgi:hypothetical protein
MRSTDACHSGKSPSRRKSQVGKKQLRKEASPESDTEGHEAPEDTDAEQLPAIVVPKSPKKKTK